MKLLERERTLIDPEELIVTLLADYAIKHGIGLGDPFWEGCHVGATEAGLFVVYDATVSQDDLQSATRHAMRNHLATVGAALRLMHNAALSPEDRQAVYDRAELALRQMGDLLNAKAIVEVH